MPDPTPSWRRTAEAIRFLRSQTGAAPDLPWLAQHLGVVPAVAGREFRRLVGIGPKRFLSDLACRRATGLLDRGLDLLTTSLEAGLSGPGQLHDHIVTIEALSPGEWKSRGAGAVLQAGCGLTPFGRAVVVQTRRGLHRLEFLDPGEDDQTCLAILRQRWPAAHLEMDPRGAQALLDRIFACARTQFRLDLVATSFQVAVWKALLHRTSDGTCSYQAVAQASGHPQAVRAVAGAVAANPVALLIPCHRVLAEDGALCGYRWGLARKLGLLAWEDR